MRFMRSALIGFVFAFLGVLAAVLLAHFLGRAPVQMPLTLGIATGSALAAGARSQWRLSGGVDMAVVAVLVGAGAMIGHYFSAHA